MKKPLRRALRPSTPRVRRRRARGAWAGALAFAALTAGALAQEPAGEHRISFSITWHDRTIAVPGCAGGPPITEGDVLAPCLGAPEFGPLPQPRIFLTGAALGLQRYSICVDHPPGVPCGIEVDALSYGVDHELDSVTPFRISFTVDAHAAGHQPFFQGPNVQTEGGTVGDLSADLLLDLGLPPGPIAPNSFVAGHVAAIDGNGLRSASGFVYRGLGLQEPNPPTTSFAHPGDAIDAWDFGPVPPGGQGRVFFSLDAHFVDPRTNNPNSGSAIAHNVRAADVLTIDAGGGTPFQVYAQAASLGLDLLGMHTDDLVSIVLVENGVPGFQPSTTPYDWLAGPGPGAGTGSDMLLFSVRVGSAVIGMPDSIFGEPIEPGDLLVPPVAGGVSPFPGIFFPAESLGLATSRSDGAAFGDELGGVDITPHDETYNDCNGNDRDDSVDIAVGDSDDDNLNGIPDECEPAGMRDCFCDVGPCGNSDATAGCANSTGSGASLDAFGSTSVTIDDLMLVASGLPANKNGIFYMGAGSVELPFGDGERCVSSGGVGLFRFPLDSSGPLGSMSLGPQIVDFSCSSFSSSGCILAGSTWRFQNWYRDPMGPCASGFNLSNGLSATFTP